MCVFSSHSPIPRITSESEKWSGKAGIQLGDNSVIVV